MPCTALDRHKLELELEATSTSRRCGTATVSEKPVGFTDVRVKVDMECEGIRRRDQRAGDTREENGRPSPTPSPGPSILRSACSEKREGAGDDHGFTGSIAGRSSGSARTFD